MRADVKTLSEKLTAARLEAQQLTAALADSKKAHTEIESELQEQQQAVERTHARAVAQEVDLATARRQIDELKNGLANANDSIKDLQAEFNAFDNSIESNVKLLFEATTQKFKSKVKSVGAKLGTAAKEINKLNASNIEVKNPTNE